MTNLQTIRDLRLVAEKTRVPSIRDVANQYADSLEPKEGDQTLQEWITTKGTRTSPLLTEDEKTVIRGLLGELQYLYEMGRCHGGLNPTSVLISVDNVVKLVDMKFIPCTYNNMDNDYKNLAKILAMFRPLPPDISHLVKYLTEGNKMDKSPIHIFNPAFLWDNNQVCTVIECLTSQLLRYVGKKFKNGIYNASKSAAEVCFPGGWTSQIVQAKSRSINASYLFQKLTVGNKLISSDDCLVRFMRDVYAHPPYDKNNNPLTQEEVTKAFLELFPGFLTKLVEELVKNGKVRPGGPIDRNYIGAKRFCLV